MATSSAPFRINHRHAPRTAPAETLIWGRTVPSVTVQVRETLRFINKKWGQIESRRPSRVRPHLSKLRLGHGGKGRRRRQFMTRGHRGGDAAIDLTQPNCRRPDLVAIETNEARCERPTLGVT